MDSAVMRVGRGESMLMVCCQLSILFVVVVLVGMVWGVKGYRHRQRQRPGRENEDMEMDFKECEKVCLSDLS